MPKIGLRQEKPAEDHLQHPDSVAVYCGVGFLAGEAARAGETLVTGEGLAGVALGDVAAVGVGD